jgi:DNA-binding MarR family transcriptional regulator
MTDLNNSETEREQELNQALEALHFAFRAVVAKPDAILAEHGLSRVHHRLLYFVGRNPGLSVNELLAILRISKQSLNTPLRQLIELKLIQATTDTTDRRIKRLTLTQSGLQLESQLSGDQRQRFARVFEIVGPEGEAVWHQVMQILAENP